MFPTREKPRSATMSAAGMSLEEGRAFWSFQPVERPAIPSVQGTQWVKSPIDAFVLAELEANGLAAPPADRRTLIRRLTYDFDRFATDR